MDLITPREVVDSYPFLKTFGGESLVRLVFRLFKLDVFNRKYSSISDQEAPEFINSVINLLDLHYELDDSELQNIPKNGSFITVSNHAYGGIDGILMLQLLPRIRPDFRVIVNFILEKLKPLNQYFLGVNPFESYKDLKSSFGGLREAFLQISNGHPIGIFPAGEVSTYRIKAGGVTDKEWQYSILKFIKKASVPVVPIYFEGHNSATFHLLGMIHPMLRTIKLPSEMLNKQGKVIKIRIGAPITVKEQNHFKDIGEYGHFLRMRTYDLGISPQMKKKPCRLSHHV
ncbi:MAG: lysophospholipid acyltransferase family protein, partial [Bacteroidota bacterium]|nr:lysophospholipid acyltransferase family protein [Bacteroidota bacterium]